jgi:mono/diheme cytochrome c family protein
MRPNKWIGDKRKPFLGVVVIICLSVCSAVGGAGATSQATSKGKLQRPEPIVKGDDLFRDYCAVCHGLDAKGNGPLAQQLRVMPANLTILAKNNHGQFPAARVRKMIAGDEPETAHGTREMPVWGPIFRGIVSDQAVVDMRLDNLVKYLRSIQQK